MTETEISYQRTKMQKEQILKKLKAHGYRITRQRKILLEVILQGECSNCKEIYVNAKKADKRIGMATVYRMLRVLEEIGAVSRMNSFQLSFHQDQALHQVQVSNQDQASNQEQAPNQSQEIVCIIELDDHTMCRLCAQGWYKVLEEGLRICGYLKQQKVICIKLISCEHT